MEQKRQGQIGDPHDEQGGQLYSCLGVSVYLGTSALGIQKAGDSEYMRLLYQETVYQMQSEIRYLH